MTETPTDVGSLTAYAFVLTRDRHLAEDLAQEAMLRLLEATDVESPAATSCGAPSGRSRQGSGRSSR